MLLVVFFVAGFLVALLLAGLIAGRRGRLALAGFGVVFWAAYALYVEELASCPRTGECDKGLGIFLLAFTLAGWLVGVALSWIIRRPR